MTMAAPEQLAAWAVAFDGKVRGLVDDVDASWEDELLAAWGFLDGLSAEQVGPLWPRLWRDRLKTRGGWPPLGRFAEPMPRLGLLSRGDLLHRLCTLALARRPGVLRCCIDRSVRAPLQRALGDTFTPLMTMSARGRPVEAELASWTPVQWACVGFADWTAGLGPDDDAVREIVRWSLPRAALDGVLEAAPVPAERDLPEAMTALAEAEVTWPC